MTSEKREAPERPGEVQAYILQKEWEHRVEGDNYKIRFCPLPGCNNSKFNFEVHRSKGCYKCWSCGEHGGFRGLLTILGDTEFLDKVPTTKTVKVSQFSPKKEQPAPEGLDESAEDLHRKLFLRQPVLDYIHGRGFNDEALRHFKIGAKKQGGEYWLVIPHYADGKCVNLKFRNIEGKRQWGQTKGGKKILFNQDCLKSYEEVIFVEGELKAIALWQMGFPNVISLTGGVSTFDPSWIDLLEPVKKIYMLMDNDEAGKKCTEELSNRLGIDRVYHLELPDAKDADEYFFEKGHTADEFSQLLRKAKRADVKNVINLATALERLETRLRDGGISNTGILTPWPAVNAITKGFRPGELIILSANPKIGKTSWAMNVTYELSLKGVPSLFYCMEMSSDRLAWKMACLANRREDIFVCADDVFYTSYLMRGKPFYLPELILTHDHSVIFETIRQAYRRYGLKIAVFDNLHFLCRDESHQREKLGVVSRGFKLLAEELQIPIILIVHPRKLKNSKQVMTSDDLKDSSSIHADADMVIVMHRDRLSTEDNPDDDDSTSEDEDNSIFSPETSIIVDAARYAPGGRAKLYFEGGQSRFLNMEDPDVPARN